jgi:membrane protein implicated in regulation of membrane protease activity
MKAALLILGLLALAMGLLWVGQGAGLVHWPASSFMIDQRPWIARGAVLALIGLVLIVMSRRR